MKSYAANAGNFKRKLYYCHIVHTPADLGWLNETVKRTSLQRLGVAGIKRKEDFINRIWTRIEAFSERLEGPFGRIRLYQDGLPVCGREPEIVRDLASNGSRNHKILERLIKKGAILMGTESAELLVEEYTLIKQTMSGGHPKNDPSRDHGLDRQAFYDKGCDGYIQKPINVDTVVSEILSLLDRG